MRLTLQGHDERYLIETLALLFFPAAGFSDALDDGLFALSQLEGETAFTRITAHGKSCEAEDRRQEGEAPSAALARSFYRAGAALTGITPPWGTLTGIRPAKLVKHLLDGGLTPEQAAQQLERSCFTSKDKTLLCAQVLQGEQRALELLDRRAVSIYLGIPFCPSRCSYCSFVSHSVEKEGRFIPAYVEALLEEIHTLLPALCEAGIAVQTVYMGGGTPTTLSAQQLGSLLEAIGQYLDVGTLSEFTVEAGRPDTITAEKLETILRCGAKRISVNTQTTDDDTLRRIGRTHSAQDFFDCYELARSLPFEVINVDLIAGLPGEPVESFCKSLCQVAQLRPENLTVHALSLKRAARLEYKDMERSRQGSNDIFSMLETTARVTREAGYSPYYLYRQRNTLGNLENVGYALPHTEGLYNVYIMGEYQSMLAMGAGGVSKVVGLPDGKIERVFHNKHFHEYIRDKEKLRRNTERLLSLLRQAQEAP